MRYLDTSLLVAALTVEERTAVIRSWLRRVETDGLAISEWTITEFSAALSIKVRSRRCTPADQDRYLLALDGLMTRSITRLPVATESFRDAAALADRHASGLHAGDALHLAIVAAEQSILCSLDSALIRAAAQLGVPVEDPVG